jgi:hypothetical protein
LQAGEDPRSIRQGIEDGVTAFVARRAQYLIYR